MQGAEQLSASVLSSGTFARQLSSIHTTIPFHPAQDVVNNSHDLTLQMAGRKERLSWLIGFINENAVLVKVGHLFHFARRRHRKTMALCRCHRGVGNS